MLLAYTLSHLFDKKAGPNKDQYLNCNLQRGILVCQEMAILLIEFLAESSDTLSPVLVLYWKWHVLH